MNVIIYLGDKNDARGVLPETARMRAQGALDGYRAAPDPSCWSRAAMGPLTRPRCRTRTMCMQHLLALGVPAGDLLPIVESRHTVDDAAMSREALAPLDVDSICVVTSHFHVQRARADLFLLF